MKTDMEFTTTRVIADGVAATIVADLAGQMHDGFPETKSDPIPPAEGVGRLVGIRAVTLSPAATVEHGADERLQVCVLVGHGANSISWQRTATGHAARTVTDSLIYVVPPGTAHQTRCEEAANVLIVSFAPPTWQRFAALDASDLTFVDLAGHDPLTWRLAEICRAVGASGSPDFEMFHLVGCAFGRQVAKLMRYRQELTRRPGRKFSPEQWDRVRQFMVRNLKYDIHVADLANQVGLGTAHFAEVFSNTSGRSPFQYIKHMRLLRAHALMIADKLSWKEAASAVGYSSEHFAGLFKKFWGHSVRECPRGKNRPTANRPG